LWVRRSNKNGTVLERQLWLPGLFVEISLALRSFYSERVDSFTCYLAGLALTRCHNAGNRLGEQLRYRIIFVVETENDERNIVGIRHGADFFRFVRAGCDQPTNCHAAPIRAFPRLKSLGALNLGHKHTASPKQKRTGG